MRRKARGKRGTGVLTVTPQPVRADRRLGQNFLVDTNVLDVIERLAQLESEDVVLEVGPGHGVLTERLVALAGHVHAIEIDERFGPHLDARLGGATNLTTVFADALRVDLAALVPEPTKMVANLPYAIATPLLMESIPALPRIERWCVMVQREVADRILASPGTRAYGAVSVLLQLTASRAGFHPVARTCFSPVPNVDSALVCLERQRDWESVTAYRRLQKLVAGSFGHRRKTLANSLSLAGVATRAQATAALGELGRSGNVRAEELEPTEFVALDAALARQQR